MRSKYFTVILAMFLSLSGQAQEDLTQKPGMFETLSRTDYASRECGFAQADMNANFERIKDIIAVVRQNPVMSDIKGFVGRARLHTMTMTCKREVWYGVPVRISFEICSYFYNKEGKVSYNVYEPPSWSLYTNDFIPGWTDIFDGAHSYFTMPLKKKTVEPGIDVYDGECWVLYNPDRPPYWLTVTVEEAFRAAREFAAKETDEYTATLNKQFLDAEWAAFSEEDRKKPAFYGGGLSRVSASPGYDGQDSIFPQIMKVNPAYPDRTLPRSAIQFIWFSSVQNKQYMKKRLDECREYMKKGSGSGCDLARFELSFGMTDIRNLAKEIGK